MFPATSITAPPESDSHILTGADRDRHVTELGEAIAALAARLHAATYALLVLLREFDAHAGWNGGFHSCAHWLHWRTGIDLGAAREKVRVARALVKLPLVSAAMQRGDLSYAKVRALTRIATPDNERQLVDVALAGTAAHVERIVRAWRRMDRLEAAGLTDRRHQHRHLTLWVDEDGMLVIRGRLPPEVGAVVQRALEAATDRLVQGSAHTAAGGRVLDERTPGQRRADALGRLAEWALAANLDRGTTGDRYQVVLHVDTAALQIDAASTGTGQAVVELGDAAAYVSAETSQRIACDASVVVISQGPDGSALDVGRKTRTIPAAIRRALAARDRGCQFPGCTARRCDGHHITHWADGGPTRLDNLVLLCRRHHRAVHEEGFSLVRGRDGAVTVWRPDGTRLDVAPAAPPCVERVALPAPPNDQFAVTGGTSRRSTVPPVWNGEQLDVVWAIDVLRGCKRMPPPAHD